MKKNIVFSTLTLLAAVSAFTACSSDENITNENNTSNSWSISVPASKGGEGTRALAAAGENTLTSTWSTSDKINVTLSSSNTSYGTISPKTEGATAQLAGTLTSVDYNLTTNASLDLYYPTSTNNNYNAVFNYTGQDGTLATLASKYDFSKATVTVTSVDKTNKTIITSAANFQNQQAIAAFKFTQNSTSISVKKLVIKAASGKLLSSELISGSTSTPMYGDLIVKPSTATTDWMYVSINNQSTGKDTYTFYVQDNSNNWWTGKATAKLLAGKFYPVTLTLTSYPITGTLNNHDWVILEVGGVKWAKQNIDIDQTSKETFNDIGTYFMWGKTSKYNYSTTITANTSTTDIAGTDADAAQQYWGSTWKMPTKAQFETLNGSGYQKTSTSGNPGYYTITCSKETGTGQSIRLYNSGYYYANTQYDSTSPCYWTSTPQDNDKAYYNFFSSVGYSSTLDKLRGCPIRPVSE
jgi:hypothetical protein